MKINESGIKVGLVGPCTAGKSTLSKMLLSAGINVRHIAQEHSYVPYMWQRITNPDVLVYLDVSYAVSLQRRKFSWTIEEYEEQLHRLQHAREHAQLYILTDPLSPQEIFDRTIGFLEEYLSLR